MIKKTEDKKQKTGISRLLELSGNKKGMLIMSSLFVLLHSILTMIPYILVFYILKELLLEDFSFVNINYYLKWASLAIVVSFVSMFISGMLSHIAAFNILYELRVKITNRIGKLPMGYLDTKSSGSLKKVLADDVERIEHFIAHGVPDTVKAVVLPLLTLTYLFVVDYRLALVSFLPLLILVFIGFYLMGGDKNKAIMEKYHKSLEDMNAGIVEFVHAMPVMKIFNQSASSFKKFSDTVNSYEKFISDWTKRSAPLWGVIMSFLANSLLPVLAFGLYLYFDKSIELSTFFLFLILGVGYVKPIFALASLSNEIVVINYGVKRIDEILFSIKEQTSGDEKFPDNYSIEFKNLNFSYKKDIHVLKNINMNIKQGSITALVGPSGSGKSTLAKLIARFYELNAGSIKIGETNINEIKTSDLMDNIGFVFQDAMMFHQSISDNIKMGAEKSREEVVKAAKMACCHDFIMNLPDGYDTHLGDKGIHLSGGEKQRIQLARVALKDAKILILDEATAFSDPENEANIMKAFSKVIKDKTVVVIAHRLSTIAEVDQIVVLDKGEIESFGRHEELLAESSLYLKMWNAHNRVKEFEIFSNRSTV